MVQIAATQAVAKNRTCSTSYLHRRLSVGYNRAARLVELMEEAGVVSQANLVGKREVLVPEREPDAREGRRPE